MKAIRIAVETLLATHHELVDAGAWFSLRNALGSSCGPHQLRLVRQAERRQ